MTSNQKIIDAVHKYFTSLVHYQYEINNGEPGSEEEFAKEQEFLDNQFLSDSLDQVRRETEANMTAFFAVKEERIRKQVRMETIERITKIAEDMMDAGGDIPGGEFIDELSKEKQP